ncbi:MULTISPECIES: phage holin [Oceanobacillus]|uniref:Holin n=1 Tax=Oceanobacillus kimchii TaxID=746691 RepID=A0ABQ5TFN4_9BACI|nr:MULTISPECIES: phage holin [Oceanobacillus]MBT2653259.1 phage holin [Oceanobacillus sp. ISL-73]MCT1577880.1 phage holin [Oceanobacillus kimchii]MCT2136868.1 phage holin [Oceanobacillus kimchii]OEH53958.1 holin [Oceanobacillus sp. E9]GLO64409.1 holin [Oceanobacillus kimchii]
MDKATVTRTLVLFIALINQILVTFDLNPIPGNETIWYEITSTILVFGAAIWSWFKNNYITLRGRKQKEILQEHQLTH